MAEDFKNINENFSQKSKIVKNNQIENKIIPIDDFDELKMYFGEKYWVTDNIYIKMPTIGEILEFGDSEFYSIVSTLCANTTSFRLQLSKIGKDWNNMSDFELFTVLIKNLTPNQTGLLFGDLNLSWFEYFYNKITETYILVYIPRDEKGNPCEVYEDDMIIIDELIYTKIVRYLRTIFNIHPKVEFAKNKATKEAMLWEDQMNIDAEKTKNDDKKNKSFLLPLISSMVNHPGFKYKTSELKEIGIYQFMDSVKRLQTYEQTTALLKGMYSGFIDSKEIKDKDINWMKDLGE